MRNSTNKEQPNTYSEMEPKKSVGASTLHDEGIIKFTYPTDIIYSKGTNNFARLIYAKDVAHVYVDDCVINN
ncbi:hypothetical protein PFDG_05188 [Plasmodium falciparum Dd2]|uniref:Uncharacterized protein n=1 Tax=Plasmodium falciparum (isolate Dd2) TaxID=57267 RepID=A0A0L7MA08_PLAF4|nr:hypothetical protein PFDG_05188 [Plasmodium falciparum Dd2]